MVKKKVLTCTDKPYNGVYFFENTGEIDNKTNLPVYKPARRLGDAVDNVSISYVNGKPFVTSPGKWYPDFKNTALDDPVSIRAPDANGIHLLNGRVRANQCKIVDFNSNGINDLIVGLGFWKKKRQ